MLPRRLADCGAHNDFEDLVLTQAGCLRSGHVLVSDPVGLLGDFVDQRIQRLGESCMVERGTALGARRRAVSFEDPRDQRLACLVTSDMPALGLGRSSAGRLGEGFEEAAPVAFGVKDATHLITTRPVKVETAVLELNARSVLAVRDEAQLEFRL